MFDGIQDASKYLEGDVVLLIGYSGTEVSLTRLRSDFLILPLAAYSIIVYYRTRHCRAYLHGLPIKALISTNRGSYLLQNVGD